MDIWEKDQLESLSLYKNEKQKVEKIIKKEIINFQSKVENANKTYQIHKKNYWAQVKNCSTSKNIVESLIESKSSCESVLKILKSELNGLQINKDLEQIKEEELIKKKKSWSSFFGIKKKKSKINIKEGPLSEDIKIMTKRLEGINLDLEKANKHLLENVSIMFYKFSIRF